MGTIIMLAVGVGIFAAAFYFVGNVWLAGGIALLLLIIWFFVNVSAGTTGLAKSNLHAYFTARSRGAPHDEALLNMIATRYSRSAQKRQAVMNAFELHRSGEDEDADVKELVYTIFEHELGARPSADWEMKMRITIGEVYSKVAEKYSVHAE